MGLIPIHFNDELIKLDFYLKFIDYDGDCRTFIYTTCKEDSEYPNDGYARKLKYKNKIEVLLIAYPNSEVATDGRVFIRLLDDKDKSIKYEDFVYIDFKSAVKKMKEIVMRFENYIVKNKNSDDN